VNAIYQDFITDIVEVKSGHSLLHMHSLEKKTTIVIFFMLVALFSFFTLNFIRIHLINNGLILL